MLAICTPYGQLFFLPYSYIKDKYFEIVGEKMIMCQMLAGFKGKQVKWVRNNEAKHHQLRFLVGKVTEWPGGVSDKAWD